MQLEEWLALPLEQLAEIVRQKQITVFAAIDGTKRHYLLRHPELQGQITDYEAYIIETSNSYARLFRLFFDAGITTLMVPLMNDDNFIIRGEKYIAKAIDWVERMTLQTPFPKVYADYNLKASFYGDYNYNPAAAFIQQRVVKIDVALQKMTNFAVQSGQHSRQILFGLYTGSIVAEFIARSGELQNKLGRVPTEEELKHEWFPDGPERVDIFVCVGWLVAGGLVPAIFSHQSVDIYNLPTLGLDLSETTLRRILYDYIFLRHSTPYDGVEYSPEHIATLREYYATHNDCLVGTGELIGPQLWHPHHRH